jgi:2-polyprenyl-3-methyl-5-hydroxy-6-metoxy-1,4-benzoquinol methylase
MDKVFEEYAQYYDLLYREKDYIGEVAYIYQMIKKYHPSAKRILDLGCGTGIHAIELAKFGYEVHGVDMSSGMIQIAKKLLDKTISDGVEVTGVSFSVGDVRSYEDEKKYDIVLSLFHVMSYQVSNSDIKRFFNTIQKSLKSNGIAIFDYWYGPAITYLRPEVRLKQISNEKITLNRVAEPLLFDSKNYCQVSYSIFIEDKETGVIKRFSEIHKMRYFFDPELELLIDMTNLRILESCTWFTNELPNRKIWDAIMVCKLG